METTSGQALTAPEEFIEASGTFLKQDFLPKLIYCLENMTEDQIWWRPNEMSNSVGNLVLHLQGNLRQWIVMPLGGKAFRRDRQAEFATRERVPKEQLIAGIQAAVDDAADVIRRIQLSQLLV